MRKSKNRYFYDMFVFPGDAPGAITLNVVWMEREFDAYKLSRCMCPSSYNRIWDRAKYWSKIVIFSYPLAFDVPVKIPVGISPPRLVWKILNGLATRWWKISKMCLFVLAQLTNVTDRQTDGHTSGDGNSRAMHSIWCGFSTTGYIQRLTAAFIRRRIRRSYFTTDFAAVATIIDTSELNLFRQILTNPNHITTSSSPKKLARTTDWDPGSMIGSQFLNWI